MTDKPGMVGSIPRTPRCGADSYVCRVGTHADAFAAASADSKTRVNFQIGIPNDMDQTIRAYLHQMEQSGKLQRRRTTGALKKLLNLKSATAGEYRS
jgi:hypothetical protein